MIASGSQNQLQSSLAPLGDLFKTLMFLLNLNGFNSSPLPSVHGFNQRKGSSRMCKENGSKWFYHFPLYPLVFVCISCVFCFIVSQFSFYALHCLTCFCWLFFNFASFFSYKKIEKSKKYKNSVCFVYIGTCVPWMAIERKWFSEEKGINNHLTTIVRES